MAAHILIYAAAHDPTAGVLADALRERGATADVVDAALIAGPAARATAVAGFVHESTVGKLAVDAGHLLATRVPLAKLVRVRGGGHLLNLTSPKEFQDAVTAFLSKK